MSSTRTARPMTQAEHDIVELETRLEAARQRGGPVTLPHDLAFRFAQNVREVERLRRYRDDNEKRVRGETVVDGEPLKQADADYMRVLGSYGSRVCRAGWFYALACRIEATVARTPESTDASRAPDTLTTEQT